MKLQFKHDIPPGFLTLAPRQLHAALGGPTLLCLAGERNPALFVSCMLHGNEFSGLLGVQSMLKHWLAQGRPRQLMIFIGNTEAAAHGLRQLPGGHDFNRIWSSDVRSSQYSFTQELLEHLSHQHLLAAIDIHNNSGKNPHYSCLHSTAHTTLSLARRFSSRMLHIHSHPGALSMALQNFAPAMAVECGTPGSPQGLQALDSLLQELLITEVLSPDPIQDNDTQLYEILATIKMSDQATFGFQAPAGHARPHAIDFVPHLEDFNFVELKAGTLWGTIANSEALNLFTLKGASQELRPQDFFSVDDNQLRTRHNMTCAMLTTQHDIVRSDCLGYLLNAICLK